MKHYKYAFSILIVIALNLPLFAESKIKVENFGRVSDGYYRGAQPNGDDYSDLADLGLKAVLNLTSHDADVNEKGMVEKTGMKYFQIPMTTDEPPTAADLAAFLEIVLDPVNQPVYVHCVGGRHRTGVMTAVYRMTQHGWSADQAYDEMKKFKFGASYLHPEFKKFVYDFQAGMAQHSTSTAAK